jgi:HSP20 family protein
LLGDEFASIFQQGHFLNQSPFDIKLKDPSSRIKKEKDILQIELAVPGFSKEELHVNLIDGILVIRGIRKRTLIGDGRYILEEYDFEGFERKFNLSPEIEKEKISAVYKDGILTIVITDVPEEEEAGVQRVNID